MTARHPRGGGAAQRLTEAELERVAQRFREWQPFDSGRSIRGERAALVLIHKRLTAAADCLLAASAGNPDIAGETPIRAAWRRVDRVMAERAQLRPFMRGDEVAAALVSWAAGAKLAEQKLPRTRFNSSAARMAADTLRGLRVESHQFRCTTYIGGQAVAELVAAAKLAGVRLTPDAAQKAIKATQVRKKAANKSRIKRS